MKSATGIYGIGVDLIRIERIERIYARHGARLVDMILCPAEKKELMRNAGNQCRYLAMAFSAKEAFVKAMGTGFEGISYLDAGVIKVSKNPELVFSGSMKKRLKNLGICASQVSICCEKNTVCATVILQ